MNVKRLVVTYGGTIPTGSYANERVEFSVEADLGEGEDYLPLAGMLREELKLLFDDARAAARRPE